MRDGQERLARAGGEGEQNLAAPGYDGLLSRDVAAALVVAEPGDEVRRRVEQPVVGGLGIEGEHRLQRGPGVEI